MNILAGSRNALPCFNLVLIPGRLPRWGSTPRPNPMRKQDGYGKSAAVKADREASPSADKAHLLALADRLLARPNFGSILQTE